MSVCFKFSIKYYDKKEGLLLESKSERKEIVLG